MNNGKRLFISVLLLLLFINLVSSCATKDENDLTVMGKNISDYNTTTSDDDSDLIVDIPDDTTPEALISDLMSEDELLANLDLETDLTIVPVEVTLDDLAGSLAIDFMIKNGSNLDLSLLYNTSQTYDFTVSTRMNKIVYTYSEKKDFSNQITEIYIPRQSEYHFTVEFDYKDRNGLYLDKGNYTLNFSTEFRLYNKKILLSQTEAFEILY